MKKIKYQIRNFFGFSKKEANGFVVLVILIALLLIIPYLVEFFYQPNDPGYAKRDKEKLDSLISILETSRVKVSSPKLYKSSSNLSLAHFDPNSASEEQLKKVLGAKVARTIIHFREKGGKFFVKKDLSKIYGIDGRTYERIENYLLLPDQIIKQEAKSKATTFIEKEVLSFDINRADTTSLQKIKGIGKVLSARIIKYRDKLGGFVSMSQLNEVYGLSPEVITELNRLTYIENNFLPSKISINTQDYKVLVSHPYLRKKYAGVILNYHKQRGPYNSLDELKKIPSIVNEDLIKMMPYLSL